MNYSSPSTPSNTVSIAYTATELPQEFTQSTPYNKDIPREHMRESTQVDLQGPPGCKQTQGSSITRTLQSPQLPINSKAGRSQTKRTRQSCPPKRPPMLPRIEDTSFPDSRFPKTSVQEIKVVHIPERTERVKERVRTLYGAIVVTQHIPSLITSFPLSISPD